jgi:4-hydroxy-L-threonine phosphate dehydrogenase PdxA
LSLICPTTQLYTNKHNFLSDRSNKLKFHLKFFEILFYLELKFQDDQNLVRLSDKGSKLLSKSLYVFLNKIHSSLPLVKSAINNSIVKYKHHIHRLDDILNELHGCCMFSKIDLKISYHQIMIKKIMIKKMKMKEKITLRLNMNCLNG